MLGVLLGTLVILAFLTSGPPAEAQVVPGGPPTFRPLQPKKLVGPQTNP